MTQINKVNKRSVKKSTPEAVKEVAVVAPVVKLKKKAAKKKSKSLK